MYALVVLVVCSLVVFLATV